jgi:hypothetical protein
MVTYTSVEKYPVDRTILSSLNHHLYAGPSGKELSELINAAPWDEWAGICKNFSIRKVRGDITEWKIPGRYDLIYFDAFGPENNRKCGQGKC